MPNTFTLIASSTVGSGGASTIDFTSIPGTYTDLCLKLSTRDNRANPANGVWLRPNGSSTNLSGKQLYGTGASVASQSQTTGIIGVEPSSTTTASTFSNIEVYIPNYTSSNNKSATSDSVQENNATSAEQWLVAYLWSNTAAITSITIIPEASASFVQHSTAYLYGVKNA
jgi:hypothetical protein